MSQELSVEGQHESIGKDRKKDSYAVSFEGGRDSNCNVPLTPPPLPATSLQIESLYWNERLHARLLMNW